MKKFLLQITGLALLTGLLLTTGCTEDGTTDPGGGSDIPPLISLASEIDFVSTDAEVDAGGTFSVKLRLQTGTNPLQSVRIREDNTNLPNNRFVINGGAITSNNPFLITGASKSGATFEIDIQVHDGFQETKTYNFEVTDEKGLTDAVSLAITTKGEAVTTLTGVLLNQAGPAGQGGLDLNTGDGTGTVGSDPSTTNAEIRDMGIDINQPNAQNWRQQIAGINGAVIRTIGGGMPENFNFGAVAFKEEIAAAFESGNDLTATLMVSGVTYDVTSPLKEGDIFTVKRDDEYYLVQVAKITVTASDNQDSYEFNIKY